MKLSNLSNRILLGSLIVGIALGVVGCGPAGVEDPLDPQVKKGKPFSPNVDAGLGAPWSPKNTIAEAKGRFYLARVDPFALTHDQLVFEKSQEKERYFQEMGNFYPVVPPPETEEPPPTIEKQPYRRLAGVVVGQSVIGIIELGPGDQQLIRPGQLVPGTNWRVVSIDGDKAILRRGGNVLPHEITVRLESSPMRSGGGGGSGGGTGGGSGGGSGGGGGRSTGGTGVPTGPPPEGG